MRREIWKKQNLKLIFGLENRGGKQMSNERQPVLALLSEGPLDTDYGRFKVSVFHDGDQQAVVLSTGELAGQEDVICRIHSECISSHVFYGEICDCSEQMIKSQKLIQNERQGLIIYLEQEGRGAGAAAHVATLALKEQGIDQREAYTLRGFPEDTRRFDIAAKVIRFLQIKSVILISSNKKKIQTLQNWKIEISGTKDLEGYVTILGKSKRNRVDAIQRGKQKPIIESGSKGWVFIIGDLIIDYRCSQKVSRGDVIVDKPAPIIGGTAFNAAKAFNKKGFKSIVFGKVGDDKDGQLIRTELERREITSLIGLSKNKSTGNCSIIFIEGANHRVLIKEEDNANDYDLGNLEQAIQLSQIGKGNFALIVGHPFVRFGRNHTKKLIDMISETGAKIILDLVPHNMYEKVTLSDFNYAVDNNADVIIGAYHTLMKLIDREAIKEKPDNGDWKKLLTNFKSKFLVVRYGIGSISKQAICKRIAGGGFRILEVKDTGYTEATAEEKRGFGDILTADFLLKYQDEL